MTSLKCLDKLTGKNKCPDNKNPNKVYCDTRTGKCYTSTKSGLPHGFRQQQDAAMKMHENLTYDEKYKLFGFATDIEKHKKIFEKPKEKELNVETLKSFSLARLKEIAREIDPDWNVVSYTTQKTLISAIIRKRSEKERRINIEEVERDADIPYESDEFDQYDIWTNELSKNTNPRILEYIPYEMKQLNETMLREIRNIWK